MATSIPHQGTPSTSGQGQSGQQGQGSTSASGLVDKLAQNAEQTAAKAIDRVKESRGRAEQGIEQQHQKITSRIRGLGAALRGSGETLQDNEQVSALLNIAGEQVDRVAEYVDNATPRGVARDIERFAREKPAWFFGGAFLAGLALGRFAKSSAASSSDNDGMRFSEDDDLTGRYPQARGGASATYAGQSSYQRSGGQSSGLSGSQQGASYSGYTSGGSATSSGPYTGSGTGTTGSGSAGSGTSGSSGGTTQRMGSSYPSGATSSGYTGGAATSGTPSTTSPVSGSSGYSTGPSGGSYSGTSSSGSASNPSSTSTTPSTAPGSSQSATRTPNNGGTSGASKS